MRAFCIAAPKGMQYICSNKRLLYRLKGVIGAGWYPKLEGQIESPAWPKVGCMFGPLSAHLWVLTMHPTAHRALKAEDLQSLSPSLLCSLLEMTATSGWTVVQVGIAEWSKSKSGWQSLVHASTTGDLGAHPWYGLPEAGTRQATPSAGS